MPLGTEVDLGLGDIVLDGDPALPPKKGEGTAPPPILAQTAAWIKMPLCTMLGLGPKIVLHREWGPSSSPKRGTTAPPPIFGPCPLWPNGWMDQHATWYVGRPRS